MAIPHGGGLFGLGSTLSFRKSRVTSFKNDDPIEAGADDFLAARWDNFNSRKIALLTEKEDTARMQRNKSYTNSISLILNRGDDGGSTAAKDVAKPARIQRSNTTLGLGGGGGGFQSRFLQRRSSGEDALGVSSVSRRPKTVERSSSKRVSCINFGSESLLDSSVPLPEGGNDVDVVPPMVSHRRPASTVLSTSSYSNGVNDADSPLSHSLRRSASFHHQPRTAVDSTNVKKVENRRPASTILSTSSTNVNEAEPAVDKSYQPESDLTHRFRDQPRRQSVIDAINEANEKRQALIDHVLSYDSKAAQKQAEDSVSLRESIERIEKDVKSRLDSVTASKVSNAQEGQDAAQKPFKSRFLSKVRAAYDEDWSQKEWQRFFDDGVLIEMAVEVIVLVGRGRKPNFVYERDTPAPRAHVESSDTIIVSQPPTPTDRYGRKRRDPGGDVPDHSTNPIVPDQDSPTPQRWESWGRSRNLSNRQSYLSRLKSIESRRQSISASESSSTPPPVPSGQSSKPATSRPASTVLEADNEPKTENREPKTENREPKKKAEEDEKENDEDKENAKTCVSTSLKITMNFREKKERSKLDRYKI